MTMARMALAAALVAVSVAVVCVRHYFETMPMAEPDGR